MTTAPNQQLNLTAAAFLVRAPQSPCSGRGKLASMFGNTGAVSLGWNAMGFLDWFFGKLGTGRRSNAELSAEFLAAHQWRLDAIGPWSIEADADNLDIKWRNPASLRGQWVPLDLQFHTDSGTVSFDPDERMFELWELFLSRKSEFVRQLQGLTPEAVPESVVGAAEVVVYREGHGDRAYYTLQVLFNFEDDPEHLYWADYDEEAGGFVSLDC